MAMEPISQEVSTMLPSTMVKDPMAGRMMFLRISVPAASALNRHTLACWASEVQRTWRRGHLGEPTLSMLAPQPKEQLRQGLK